MMPTLHVEFVLAEDYWAILLRAMIAVVRLSPLMGPCLPCCIRLFGWGAGGRRSRAAERFRLTDCGVALVNAIVCPEVRWGVAITLDMWYLLSTPLNKGLREAPLIILLISNVLLCFVDTVMLILMLAAKGEEFPNAERVDLLAATQPRSLMFTEEEASVSKFDPTCIICLSDFRNGDEVSQLPCNHTFHTECISTWLAKSRHCPLRCPRPLLPPQVTQTPVEALPPPRADVRRSLGSGSTASSAVPELSRNTGLAASSPRRSSAAIGGGGPSSAGGTDGV